jgi:DNA-binding response OmpR family regulator
LPFRHRLTLVRDGASAFSFLRKEGVFASAPTPDIVLLDLVLPKLPGLCVLRAIRVSSDYP